MRKHCVKVSTLLYLAHSHQLHSPTDAQLLQNDCNQLYKIIIKIYVKNLLMAKQQFSTTVAAYFWVLSDLLCYSLFNFCLTAQQHVNEITTSGTVTLKRNNT